MIRSILKKIFKPKYMCELGKDCFIYPEAKIDNISKKKNNITLGIHTHLKGELLIFPDSGEISIGDYCYIGENSKIWSAKKIIIKNNVLISHNVTILDSLTHPINPILRHEQFKKIISTGHPNQINLSEKEIFIDNDVWIGCMSVILKGVRIGKGSIVGAGSVVTKDVPAYHIVAGNPARIIREIPVEER